jgi:hypothetical protein
MLAGLPIPHGREELLHILAAAEGAEVEIRQLEERSTQYWLLQYLTRQKMDQPLAAVIVDGKGHVELEDFYLRAKVAGGVKGHPGDRLSVRIESIDPVRGELRLSAI